MRASWGARRPARGYDRWFRAVPLLLGVLALGAARTHAQVEITINPMMVKGPRGAPVTIIEFSDYQ